MLLTTASSGTHCGSLWYAQASMNSYLQRLTLGNVPHLKPYFIICGRLCFHGALQKAIGVQPYVHLQMHDQAC